MRRLRSGLRWLVLTITVLILNFPVLATLVTSFKSSAEISRNPGLWIREPTLDNYLAVLTVSERLNIFAYLYNSLVAALIGAIVPMILCFPMAYAVARRELGRRYFLALVINLRALPLIIFAIPLYMMYRELGLLDTRLGLGLILAVVNLPLTLLILVNAVHEVPTELEEAARMDGARLGSLLLRIVLPVCRPAFVTVFIFGFITAWNEFLFGLMLTTREAVPMTVGASFFFSSGAGGVQWGLAAAVIVVAAFPPMLLGMLMYRRIGGSMMAGAIKG